MTDRSVPYPQLTPATSHAPGAGQPGGLCIRIALAGPGTVVIGLAGEVDLATADTFDTAVAAGMSAAGAGGRTVLDLTGLTFLDAHGLSIIAAGHARVPRCGATMVLVVDENAATAASLRFLRSVAGPGLYPTLPAALAARHDRPRRGVDV